MTTEVRYARNGDVHLAYTVRPGGPRAILFMSDWVIPIDAMEECPQLERFLERLSRLGRVILWDRRGVGLSDPALPTEPPTLEQWVDDALAVVDDVGADEVVLFGGDIGGKVATMFSATHPHRTAALVVANTCMRYRRSDEQPWAATDEEVEALLSAIEAHWGTGYPPPDVLAPSVADDAAFQAWSNRAQRRGASPATAVAIMRMSCGVDLRPILPSIRVPTLVLHARDDRIMPVQHGRTMASLIPGARYVELKGGDHPCWLEDGPAVLDEVEEFLTGVRSGPDPERVLAAVLFSDIVGSTERAAEMGDRSWRELLDRHDATVAAEIAAHRGELVKSTGDGVVATFDGPGRAVRCAWAMHDHTRALDLELRIGVHCGEIERRGTDVGGIAVHIASRVQSAARPGEVLVSRTVADLVVGSQIEFGERGDHALKGVPGSWQLLSALRPDG